MCPACFDVIELHGERRMLCFKVLGRRIRRYDTLFLTTGHPMNQRGLNPLTWSIYCLRRRRDGLDNMPANFL